MGSSRSATAQVTTSFRSTDSAASAWFPAFEYLRIAVKRAFSRTVLKDLPLLENSDDFLFDNQVLAQCVMFGFRMGEVSCPTKYFPEASSINFRRSVKYGLGVLLTSVQFRLQKIGLGQFRIFNRQGRCLEPGLDAGYYSPKITDGRSGG